MFLRGQLPSCWPAKAISQVDCLVNQFLFPHFLRKSFNWCDCWSSKACFLNCRKVYWESDFQLISTCKEVTVEYYQMVENLSHVVGKQFASHLQLLIICHTRPYLGFSQNCQTCQPTACWMVTNNSKQYIELQRCFFFFVKIGNAKVICLANIQENFYSV